MVNARTLRKPSVGQGPVPRPALRAHSWPPSSACLRGRGPPARPRPLEVHQDRTERLSRSHVGYSEPAVTTRLAIANPDPQCVRTRQARGSPTRRRSLALFGRQRVGRSPRSLFRRSLVERRPTPLAARSGFAPRAFLQFCARARTTEARAPGRQLRVAVEVVVATQKRRV